MGTVNVTHAVLPIMMRNKTGKIINFSGGGAVNNFPNFSSYATSKAAVVRFTETIAEELKSYNIQINAIARELLIQSCLMNHWRLGRKRLETNFTKRLLNKKEGGDSPQLAVDLILFLISDQSFKLTGKLISAKWDAWKDWKKMKYNDLSDSSEYNLRRIDNKQFREIK